MVHLPEKKESMLFKLYCGGYEYDLISSLDYPYYDEVVVEHRGSSKSLLEHLRQLGYACFELGEGLLYCRARL